MHQKEHTDNIPEGEKLFFASLPLFFFNLPSQTEMISCHESNVLISLLLGQETKVTPLIASRHYLHMMIEKKKQNRILWHNISKGKKYKTNPKHLVD